MTSPQNIASLSLSQEARGAASPGFFQRSMSFYHDQQQQLQHDLGQTLLASTDITPATSSSTATIGTASNPPVYEAALEQLDTCAAYLNITVTILAAVWIFSYRIFLRLTPDSSHAKVLLGVKMSIGWVIGVMFLHSCDMNREYGISIIAVLFSILCGGPDCIPITITFAWFWATVSGAGALSTFGGDSWKSKMVTAIFTTVLTLLSICIKQVFQNWELLLLPLLSATALFINFGLPVCVVYGHSLVNLPTNGALELSLLDMQYLWAGFVVTNALLQVISYRRNPIKKMSDTYEPRRIDVGDPLAGQNDIVRRLLLDDGLQKEEVFESRFPIISGMAQDGGASKKDDPFRAMVNAAPQASTSGGMVERALAKGEPLTETQMKILEICKNDEQERNRLLFGGGLW